VPPGNCVVARTDSMMRHGSRPGFVSFRAVSTHSNAYRWLPTMGTCVRPLGHATDGPSEAPNPRSLKVITRDPEAAADITHAPTKTVRTHLAIRDTTVLADQANGERAENPSSGPACSRLSPPLVRRSEASATEPKSTRRAGPEVLAHVCAFGIRCVRWSFERERRAFDPQTTPGRRQGPSGDIGRTTSSEAVPHRSPERSSLSTNCAS
jgi:hypothetical protein